MAFNGDTFQTLRLPPYSGPIASHFRDIADALTLLKTTGGGGGGSGVFSGARVQFSANQINQNFENSTVLSWNREVFDVGGWYASSISPMPMPTRFTVPAGVTHVLVSGGVDLSDISTSSDICFDFSKNGLGLGIGFSVKNAAFADLLWKATSDTGVLDVVAGDYFEMNLEVASDTDFTIDENGTYFSITALSSGTVGGGTTVEANPGGTPGTDLTTIKIGTTDYNIAGTGGTVTVAGMLAAIGGNPNQGEVIKYVSGGSLVWAQDLQGTGGSADGVASGLSFAKSGNTVTATLTRTNALGSLTGDFDVFSGAYGDLTSKPTLFSGVYGDLTGKPTLAKSIFLVSNLPPAASAARNQLYGLVTVPNVSDPASSLHYLKKETVGTFRIRFDDVSSRSSSANFTAYGYASIDAPSGGYYGMGVLDGISPAQALTNGVIALVRTRTRSGASLTRYRVRLSDTLRDGNTTIWLAMRPEHSTDTPVTLELTYDATAGDFASNNLGNDPFGSIPHSVWEVQLATQQDLAILSVLPTVTENQMSQLVDDVILHSTISDVNQHVQQLIDAIDLSVYVLNTSNRLIPGGQTDDQILRATGSDEGDYAWEDLPAPTPVPDLTPYALKTTIANRLVPASGTDNFILRRTGTADGAFAWEAETATYTDTNAVAAVAAADPYVRNTGDSMTGGLQVIPAINQVALLLDATALTTSTPFVFNISNSGNQQAMYLRRGSSGEAWMTVDGNIGGGDDNPGIGLGPGGLLTRDVTLFRGGAGILRTNSIFESPSLQLTTDATDVQRAASRDSLLGAGGADGQILTREVVMSDPPSLRWGLWVVPANAAGDLDTPTAAMAGMSIGVKDDGLYHVEPVPHHAILPTGTWGLVPTSYPWHDADGNTVKNFYHGAFPNHSHSGFSNDNEFFLDYSNRHFYHSEAIVPGGQSRRIVQRADPIDWIGFGTMTELLARATAVGQWGYDTDEVGNTAVSYLTAFMAGVPAITDYQWRFSSGTSGSLEIQKDGTQDYLGAPVINFAGSGVSVSGNTVTVASPPTTGITQNAADARYVNETGDTMTGPLIVGRIDGDGSTLHVVGAHGRTTPTTPGIIDITGPADSVTTQTALTIRRHQDTVDYFHVTGDVGGTSDSRPGFLLGVGGTTIHDTNLYRSAVDTLETDDAFIADTLAVTGTLATTQASLGIVADALTSGAVEPWALTANSLTKIVFSKLPNLVRDITEFSYQASARKYRLKIHRNDGNAIATVDTAAHPVWITAAALTQANIYDAVAAILAQGSNIILTPDSTNHMISIAGPVPGMGATAFLALSDTPTTFSSQAGKFVSVNAGTDALVFVDAPSGDNTLAVLLESLNGDGTNDLPSVNPVGGTTDQDYLLIYDKSGGIIARTGVGDLAAILPTSVSANPGLVATDGTLTSLHIGGMNWRLPIGVSANPTLVDTDGTLTGLTIGGTNWRIPVGVTVVANPGGSGLTDLNTVTIGSTDYNVIGADDRPLSVPPETLYEDTSDGSYSAGVWNNLSGFRALTPGDDTKLVEVRCQLRTNTFIDYDFFYFPVETFRVMSFNTSSTASANNSVRFKTLRNDTAVSSFSDGSLFVARNTATTWRFGQAFTQYKRLRFRLLAVNGVSGPRGLIGLPGQDGATIVANPFIQFPSTAEIISTMGIHGTNYRLAPGTIVVETGITTLPNATSVAAFTASEFDIARAGQRATVSLASGIGKVIANPVTVGPTLAQLNKVTIGGTNYILPGASSGLTQDQVDARVNVLVPTTDIHAVIATNSDSGSWGDRHSWSAYNIQRNVRNSMNDNTALGPGLLYGYSIPIGGTSGQVLAKSSDDDRATEWVDPQTGGGGGTTVVANPGGTGLGDLTSITIGSTSFDIPVASPGTVDAAAIIAAVSGSPSTTNDVITWGTGDTLSWAAGGGSTTVAGLGTEEIGSANIALTTTTFTATGFILPLAADNPWLLVNIGSIGSAIPEDARWFMVNTAQLLGKNSTSGGSPSGANSVFVELGVNAGFSRQFMYFSTIQSTRELLVTSSSTSLEPTPLSVHKIVPSAGGGGTTFDINALTAFPSTETVNINNDLWAMYDSSASGHRKLTSVQAVRAMFRANTVNMNPDSIADADHIQFYDHTDGGVARALTWASARDKLITDADLNATAADEATDVAPSRQVVAELRDALTVGSLNILGLTNNTGGNVEATADYFAMYASDPVSGTAGNRRVNTFHAYEGMINSAPAASDFQFGNSYMFMGAYINASGTHPTHVLYSDLQAKVLAAIPTGTTPRTDEAIRDVSYAGMQGGYGITVDVQDSENKVFISAESSADSQFVIAMIEPNGDIWAVNRLQPSESFLLSSTGITNVQGVARDGDKFYFCTSAREVLEYDAIAGTTSSQGTLPSSHGSVCHAFFAANNTFYAITEDAGDNYFWSISDLTNPSGASGVGAVTPFTVNFIAGIEFNGRILISSSGGRIYEWAPGASSATQVHDQVAPGKATTRPLIVFGGSLYASVNSSSGTTDFYSVDLDTPANTRLVGVFPSAFNRPTGGGILLAPLSTSFVEEGTNIYYTNARADARILAPARTGNTDRWAKNKLPTDVSYGSGGGGSGVTVVNTPGELPTPSSSTDEMAYFVQQDDGLRIGVEDKYTTSDPTGTFTNIPSRSDFHVANSPPMASSYTTGHFVYFNFGGSTGGSFYEVVTNGVDKNFHQVSATTALDDSRSNTSFAVTFLGSEATVAEALRFIFAEASSTNYFWYNTTTGAMQRMTPGTFTAAGGQVDHHLIKRVSVHWDDIFGEPDFGTAALLDTGSSSGNIPVLGSSGLLSDNSLTANIPRKDLSNTFENTIIVEPPGNSVCLFLKATNLTTQTPFVFNISESGNQQAMWLRRGNSDQAWMTVDGNAGGTNEMPGIFFGPGGPSGARDVVLHRRAADVLKTPDAMDVGSLQVAGMEVIDSSGILAHTSLSGVFDIDRIPDLPTSKITTGRLNSDRLPSDTLYTGDALATVATDSTLNGTGTTSSPLGVSVQEIISELTERIRYFTDPPFGVSNRGSTIGHRYITSPHVKTVYRVGIRIDPPTGDKRYKARIFAVSSSDQITSVLGSSNERSSTSGVNWFDFPDGGVLIPASQRVAVVLSRTHAGNNVAANIEWGTESANSPYRSYDDASTDFDNQGFVEYSNANPGVSANYENRGSQIHGNIDIRYRVTFDHGSLIGDGISADQVTSGRFDVDRVAWTGSQTSYDALTPDSDTIYLITG